MAKYYDEEGNEVEAIDATEVEVKTKEAVEKYKAENPTTKLEDAIKEKDEQLNAVKSELEKLSSKDFNFKQLRESAKKIEEEKNAKETELEKLKTELSEKISKIEGTINTNKKTELVTKLVGDDDELKKKIDYYYDRVSGEQDVQKRIEMAYFLATKTEAPSSFISSAGAGNIKVKSDLTIEQKSLASKLGLSEDDFKKYHKK